MSNFQELSAQEYNDINGGGAILAGLAIAGGCVLIGGVFFAVGYGIAMWLG